MHSTFQLRVHKALQHLPMTISALRSSETGKAVKLLTKYQDADVASKANKLIEVWKQLLSEETQKDKKRPRYRKC